MTISLEVFDCYPVQSGSCARQKVYFGFKLESDVMEYIYDIDWDTIDISFKKDGGTYEAIVDDGDVSSKNATYALLCKRMITANTFAANQWAASHNLTEGCFVWNLPAALPDGNTYWLKIEFDDVNGSSYSEEWFFVTSAAVYVGPEVLRWLDADGNKATQRFGICPHGGTISIPARLYWAPDNAYAPTLNELWIEPLHIPTDATVRLKIANRIYSPTEGAWLKIKFDPDNADGLPIEAQEYLDIEVQLTSNSTESKSAYISLALYAYGTEAANVFAANRFAANGIAQMNRLRLDFHAELFSQKTGNYFTDSLGMTIQGAA